MTSQRSYEVVFSYKPYNPVSWAIKTRIGAPYSHVAIIADDNWLGYPMVLEAMHKGVRYIPLTLWEEENNIIVARKTYTIPKEKYKEKLQRAFKLLGRDYSQLAILGILFSSQKGIDGDKKFICSEFAYDFAEEEIQHIDKPRDHITPRDMYEVVNRG